MFSLEGSVAVNFFIYNPTIADNLRQKINFLKIRGEEHSGAARSGEVQTMLYTGLDLATMFFISPPSGY